MARQRRLGFAWVVLALALASCVSPEELRREDEATCAGFGFHPDTDAFASCLQKESLARRALTSYPPYWGGGYWAEAGVRTGRRLPTGAKSSLPTSYRRKYCRRCEGTEEGRLAYPDYGARRLRAFELFACAAVDGSDCRASAARTRSRIGAGTGRSTTGHPTRRPGRDELQGRRSDPQRTGRDNSFAPVARSGCAPRADGYGRENRRGALGSTVLCRKKR
jgi:hypothetical protein